MSSNGQDNRTSLGTVSEKRDGWNRKNHSLLTVARQVRAETHASMLVVTIREGEERDICSAALKELLNIIRDQIEERSVAVIVLNEQSAIWKVASIKTLSRGDQLKYIDVEGTRVIPNNRCVAEQIKSDKVENVATGGKMGRTWESWQETNI